MWRFKFTRLNYNRLKTCKLCGRKSITISETIGVCAECLRENPEKALKIAKEAHVRSRGSYGLPPEPPKDPEGVKCTICANQCSIPRGGIGFCGLMVNKEGKLRRVLKSGEAVVSWYYDPLPTNCVAGWFCPASTGLGYPKYAYKRGPERGYFNLAVFYGACNSDCLFCQNWSYRENTFNLSPRMSVDELVEKARNPKVSCVCYFGGDPSPQIVHALLASYKILEMARKEKRIIRICWETNGLIGEHFLEKVIEVSLKSGGIIKFDLKAWTPSIYKALTGVDNKKVFENFKKVAKYFNERPEVPLLTASTLLVPGYVDEYEVEKIANFIASLNPEIPYSLLAFHPDYMIGDLPPTSKNHAYKAYKIAKEAGLKNVNIGNIWLLSDCY